MCASGGCGGCRCVVRFRSTRYCSLPVQLARRRGHADLDALTRLLQRRFFSASPIAPTTSFALRRRCFTHGASPNSASRFRSVARSSCRRRSVPQLCLSKSPNILSACWPSFRCCCSVCLTPTNSMRLTCQRCGSSRRAVRRCRFRPSSTGSVAAAPTCTTCMARPRSARRPLRRPPTCGPTQIPPVAPSTAPRSAFLTTTEPCYRLGASAESSLVVARNSTGTRVAVAKRSLMA